MMPLVDAHQDNLQFLVGGDKKTMQMYMEKGKIEIEGPHLTFVVAQ